MGKVVKTSEIERKYLVNSFVKDSLWEREFIIYQWYDKKEKERKTKLIIDLLALSAKWVRVTKNRVSNAESNKIVEYLGLQDIDLNLLIGEQFVCKRRYLKGKINIDRFIRSNGKCQFLLEDEGGESELNEFVNSNEVVLEEVTDDVSFRNTNMTTTFTLNDKSCLEFLIDILSKK